MKGKLLTGLLILFIIVVDQANAQVIRREINQHHRIKQGVRTGEITPMERKNLEIQQKDIHHDVKEARTDHVLTPVERKEIRKDQRQASRNIYRKKHISRVK
jgi:hypothetical protein